MLPLFSPNQPHPCFYRELFAGNCLRRQRTDGPQRVELAGPEPELTVL